MKMRTRIQKELKTLNKIITETNSDIMEMINLSAEAEMLLRKKSISGSEAEVIENKLFNLIKKTKDNQ